MALLDDMRQMYQDEVDAIERSRQDASDLLVCIRALEQRDHVREVSGGAAEALAFEAPPGSATKAAFDRIVVKQSSGRL
jgi:hypothetical protein